VDQPEVQEGRGEQPVVVAVRDATQITATIAINLFFSFSVPGIDWRGHVGGLIGGALVTAALVYPPLGRQRALLQALGCVGTAVLIGAVVVARTAQLTA
jgi:hypothetical protein